MVTNAYGNVLYIGVTNNLERRVQEHRSGSIPGFTQTYHCSKLVYYEEYKKKMQKQKYIFKKNKEHLELVRKNNEMMKLLICKLINSK